MPCKSLTAKKVERPKRLEIHNQYYARKSNCFDHTFREVLIMKRLLFWFWYKAFRIIWQFSFIAAASASIHTKTDQIDMGCFLCLERANLFPYLPMCEVLLELFINLYTILTK